VRAVEPSSRRIPATDGLSLHVLEWSRDGTPLVLVHGFGNDAHIWDDAAPAVAECYRTVALDLRGHGDSDRDPECRYDYDFHVADLEAVFAALGIERVVLVGHSLGGRIATLFAGRHPDRMAGLVIVDSAPELDVRGTVRIRVDLQKTGGGGDPSFGSEAEYRDVLAHNYPAVSREILARMAHHGLRRRDDGRYEPKLDPAWFKGRSDAAADEAALRAREERLTREMWDALANVPCPTLVVRGAASDVLSADVADRMVDEVLKHGQLAVIPRAGHSVMVDNPEAFRAALVGFVIGDA
jgi:pimeloyl-ACP methyl ester carboxylesterase